MAQHRSSNKPMCASTKGTRSSRAPRKNTRNDLMVGADVGGHFTGSKTRSQQKCGRKQHKHGNTRPHTNFFPTAQLQQHGLHRPLNSSTSKFLSEYAWDKRYTCANMRTSGFRRVGDANNRAFREIDITGRGTYRQIGMQDK